MNCLLKQDLFNQFEVREVTLHTSYKLHLDGARNRDFYSQDEFESLSNYLSWSEVQPHVFEHIKGTKSPSYFKIVLSTSPEDTKKMSTEASAFFLNITFKDGAINCITGTAYASFTLDKSPEKVWDDKMTKFLIANQLA